MSPQIIDLTIPFASGRDGFEATLQPNPPRYLGHECYAWDLRIKSHTGTYFETSSHVFRDGMDTIQIPAEDLILPGYCLRIQTPDRCITATDLETATPPKTSPDSALLIDTAGDTSKYFSRDAAQWMAERRFRLMGSNTSRYDSGFENPTGFFIDLFRVNIPIVANIAGLDLLPHEGFTLIVMPLKIAGIGTVPCRVCAVFD
jgi:arylformamidase